jgi:Cu/Ag efflux protein CusF
MKRYAIVGTLLLAGCTAYEPEPLAPNHPAHPEAFAARERVYSKTLAYTRADMPAPQPTAALQQGEHEAHHGQRTAVGEGKIVATVPGSGQIVLEHGEIKGFMEPMTMGYRVEPPSLMEGVKSGDRVRFTIDVSKKAIVKIEKMP